MKFRHLFVFVLAIAFFVGGCTHYVPDVSSVLKGEHAPSDPVAVLHADTAFTVAERACIDRAAVIWGLQTSGQAYIRIEYDLDFDSVHSIVEHITKGSHMMKRMTEDMDEVIAEDEGARKVLGWVTPSGGVHNPWRVPMKVAFVVDRMPDAEYFTQVVLHEFGHVLGLPHVAAINAIMFPAAIKGKTTCLKAPDLHEFCNVNICTRPTFPCE